MKKYISTLLILFSVTGIFAQTPLRIGDWRDHFSYRESKYVALAGNKVYCASSQAIFTYNLSDNSIEKISLANGLNDTGISAMSYNNDASTIVIGYDNGNVDLIAENTVYNLSDIKRKSLVGDKTIYNIFFINQMAYLSCGFGIVVLDLEKKEVKETYFIGDSGESTTVYDVTFDGDFLYAATAEGLKIADYSVSNLQDYNNWSVVTDIPNPSGPFYLVEYFNGTVIAGYDNTGNDNCRLYQSGSGGWTEILGSFGGAHTLSAASDRLVLSRSEKIGVFDTNLQQVANYEDNTTVGFNINDVTISGNDVWLANTQRGLIGLRNGNWERILPLGPVDNNTFSLTADNGNVWVCTGGLTASWNNQFFQGRFQQYKPAENKWKVYDSGAYPGLGDVRDIVRLVVDPADPTHVFAGSWGFGIYEFRNGEYVGHFTDQNSPLRSVIAGDYIRIGGIDFDSKGQLWATNSEVANVLLVREIDGSWESFHLEEIANNYSIGQVVVTDDDHKWIVVPRGRGLYAVNEDVTEKKRITVITRINDQTTVMNDIYAIAKDKNGEIWLGTSKGVAVYSNPASVFDQSSVYAYRPSIDKGDGLFYPLLSAEIVTAIAVDGANRKWMGTTNSGVYLVSEDGSEEVLHFNTENSPLPSDNILSIAIDEKSGEVFFATAQGLIAYRSDATEGENVFEHVYVYPNPVREDYTGDVVITGLVRDADIRITDISGNLVYRTESLGGQAIWDGKDMKGRRVNTGVYLVFAATQDGSQSAVAKILFIH